MKLITLTTILLLSVSCGRYAKDSEIKDLRRKLDETNKTVNDINNRLNTYIIQVDANTNAISQNEVDLYQLELNLADINDRLDLLEADSPRIVDVYKPCTNSKEVLLELDTGEILGYFEQGNKRYLSILEAGNYKTTDGTNCRFTVE